MGVYTVNQTDGSLQRVAGGTLYADAPIGAIQSYGGVIAPAGWLICDGSAVSRTEYAELFAVIGINFGEGDGETTFGIPDLRECVPVGVGKNITKSIANHDRYDLGQFKDDQLQDHTHDTHIGSPNGNNVLTNSFGSTNEQRYNAKTDSVSSSTRTGDSTHGKQLGVNYIIKAKQVAVPADIQSAIEAQNSYSTEEIYTGKRWIDGKPIYRRVIGTTTTATSNANTYEYLTDLITGYSNIPDIGTVINCVILDTNGSERAKCYNDSNGLKIACDKVHAIGSYIVLEYTKTTG